MRSILVRIHIAFASCILAVGVQAAPKPNIVHILTDDVGWQDPVCSDVDGDTSYETPNLDKLAKRGVSSCRTILRHRPVSSGGDHSKKAAL